MSCIRLCAALVLSSFASLASAESPVFALVAEFDRIAAQPLWPGFDARKVPLELYDGTNTYLFRHPAPPKEFAPAADHPGVLVYSGRHETMRANTSIELNGVIAATMIVDRADTGRAAVLAHECFHAFLNRQHPTWHANEATLFTYPIENAQALALSRLELGALARALTASKPECAAAQVRALRRERFALLPADAVAYERGTELNEGLATYIEGLAASRKDVRFRAFAPGEVRQRCYISGEALARLLDRLNPEWKSKVTSSLDELLSEAVPAGCDINVTGRKEAEEQARIDTGKLESERTEALRAFEAQPGWRVVAEAAGRPLAPAGFDPINVTRLSGTLVLHKRFVKLQNDAGSLEILDHASITEAAGAHPLFSGVRRWTATGFAEQPKLVKDGARVTLTAPSLNLTFTNAETQAGPNTITIRLH